MNKYIYFFWKRRIFIILSFIIAFAFFLRIYALGENSMWVDEAISALAAREILEKGVPVFDSGFFYSRALIFHYLLAASLAFFPNDFGARLISIFFGVATVALAFFIGKEFDKEKKSPVAGIVAALFTAILFLEIVYSRQARFYQMFQFLFFLTLFLLYKSKESEKYAWLACISLLILVNTHLAGIILLPFFFYLFVTEQKNKTLLLIPVVILLHYGPSVMRIGYGSSELAGQYVEEYSSKLFNHLRAFAFITLIGLPFAFRWNKRLSFLIILPSTTLILSTLFVKVYAFRYAYFIILLAPIFIGVVFSYFYKNSKFFFLIVLLVAAVYPSNLVFERGYLTTLYPENIQLPSFSEPVIEYKALNEETQNKIMESRNVVLYAPAFTWYFKKPDYIIPFSLNGLSTGFTLTNGKDTYTGTEEFKFQETDPFILVEDAFGYAKLDNGRRNQLETLKKDCLFLEEARLVKVYQC